MASVEAYNLYDEGGTAEVREIRSQLDEAIYGQTTDPDETELVEIDAMPQDVLNNEEIDELFQDEIDSAEPDAADNLQLYLEQIARIPLLKGLDEERELSQRIERGDKAAKDKMAESNLRLVVSIAKRYRGHGVEFLDLIQEGTLGLIRATEKYDWRKKYKFSTYATWWIRQACQRGTANQGRTIRLPVHVMERVIKINRLERKFLVQHDRLPTPEEIAEAIGMPLDQVTETLNAGMVSASLNKELGDGGENELGDLLYDETQIPTDEAALAEVSNQELRRLLDVLPERERRIVELRHGFDGKEWTLQAVGNELGLTRERVRQLETRALRKLAALQHVPYDENENGNEKVIHRYKLEDGKVSFSDDENRILDLYRRFGPLNFPDVASRLGITAPMARGRFNRIKLIVGASSREEVAEKARSMTKLEG